MMSYDGHDSPSEAGLPVILRISAVIAFNLIC